MADLINGKGIFPSGGVPAANTQNAAQDIETVGCEALFYSTRCQVRFDAFSTNAIISEIAHVANCGGFKYDCSRLDNLCLGIGGMIKKQLEDCWNDLEINDLSNACSFKYLALAEDQDGCLKLAAYTSTGAALGFAQNSSVWGTAAGGFLLPRNPSNPSTYYWYQDLVTDVQKNTVNENKLSDNHLLRLNLNLRCKSKIRFEYSQYLPLVPKYNNGDGAVAIAVLRIDGRFVEISPGLIDNFGGMSNFINYHNAYIDRILPAGSHIIDVYVCGSDKSLGIPAQVNVIAALNDSAGSISASLVA